MPVFKFRVAWEDDDNIYRDIVLKTGQSFFLFHEAIKVAFEFKDNQPASFFESNDKWLRKREISSEITINKKDAPALSMMKTPVSALVDNPDKKFIYTYDPQKHWNFLIDLIGIEKDENPKVDYPSCVKSEGLPPAQTLARGISQDKMMEIEEKYDLGKDDLDEQGFGNEGEEESGKDETDSAEERNEEF